MFTEAYERAERVGDYGLRASLGDQLVVRQQLAAELAGVPEDELGRFEERANRLVELAYFGGITVALIYAGSLGPADRGAAGSDAGVADVIDRDAARDELAEFAGVDDLLSDLDPWSRQVCFRNFPGSPAPASLPFDDDGEDQPSPASDQFD